METPNWIFDIGYSMPVTRCWSLDTRSYGFRPPTSDLRLLTPDY